MKLKALSVRFHQTQMDKLHKEAREQGKSIAEIVRNKIMLWDAVSGLSENNDFFETILQLRILLNERKSK